MNTAKKNSRGAIMRALTSLATPHPAPPKKDNMEKGMRESKSEPKPKY